MGKGYTFKLKNHIKSLTTSKLLQNSFWAIMGSAILRLAGLIAGIYIARILGANLFGAYGVFKNFILSISILSTFGLGYTATKFVAENRNSPSIIRDIIKNSNRATIGLSACIGGGLFIFSRQVSIYLFQDENLNYPVKIISVWLFFNAYTTVQQAYLAGLSLYKPLAKINSIVGIVTFALSIGFTKLWSLNGALYALVVAQMLNCFLNYFKIREYLSSISEVITEKKLFVYSITGMIKTSFPIILHDLCYSFFSWLITYLLILKFDYTQVGVYSAGMQWFMIIIYIPGVLRNVVLSTLVSNNSNDHSVISKMIAASIFSTIIVSMAIIIGQPIITQLYGKNFSNLEEILYPLIGAAILTSVYNVYAQGLIAKSRYWWVMVCRLACDVLTVIIFLYIGSFFSKNILSGAEALSWSLFVAVIFSTILIYIINRKFKRV